jgi:hypothetical protein
LLKSARLFPSIASSNGFWSTVDEAVALTLNFISSCFEVLHQDTFDIFQIINEIMTLVLKFS